VATRKPASSSMTEINGGLRKSGYVLRIAHRSVHESIVRREGGSREDILRFRGASVCRGEFRECRRFAPDRLVTEFSIFALHCCDGPLP
jgi:hypothetical protein